MVGTQCLSHSGRDKVVGTQSLTQLSSCVAVIIVRQLVRNMSNCHKTLKFIIYCKAYWTESLFSLVLFVYFSNLDAIAKDPSIYVSGYVFHCALDVTERRFQNIHS